MTRPGTRSRARGGLGLAAAGALVIGLGCGTAEEARLTTWSRVVDHEPATVIPHMIYIGASGVEIAVRRGDEWVVVVEARPLASFYAVGDHALLVVSRERDMLRRASLVLPDGKERPLRESLGGDFVPTVGGDGVAAVESTLADDGLHVVVTVYDLEARERARTETVVAVGVDAQGRPCVPNLLVGRERAAPRRLVFACQSAFAFVDAGTAAELRPAGDTAPDAFETFDAIGLPREESLWFAASEARAQQGANLR